MQCSGRGFGNTMFCTKVPMHLTWPMVPDTYPFVLVLSNASISQNHWNATWRSKVQSKPRSILVSPHQQLCRP